MRTVALALALLCSGSSALAATCTPLEKGMCHACKNCHACKHCAKEGGKCSVCKKAAAQNTASQRANG